MVSSDGCRRLCGCTAPRDGGEPPTLPRQCIPNPPLVGLHEGRLHGGKSLPAANPSPHKGLCIVLGRRTWQGEAAEPKRAGIAPARGHAGGGARVSCAYLARWALSALGAALGGLRCPHRG